MAAESPEPHDTRLDGLCERFRPWWMLVVLQPSSFAEPRAYREVAETGRPPGLLSLARMSAARRLALFVVGVAFGLYSIATGTWYGWCSGLALVVGAFVLVRRWWLPQGRR